MRRIGIITFCKVNNYGAELQAYALQKKLIMMGYHAEIIDYLFYKHPQYIKSKDAQPWIDIGFKNKAKEFLLPKIDRARNICWIKKNKLRNSKFDSFHLAYTSFSEKRFCSMDQLKRFNFNYDILMVGSDQVWNPYSNTSLDPYLLSFSQHGVKISYASSFGVSELPDSVKHKYYDCLKDFRAVSVREDVGVRLLESIGVVATQVLDPTLLLSKNDWEQVAIKPNRKNKYILLYVLTYSEHTLTLAEEIQKQTNMDIVRICHSVSPPDRRRNIINIIDAGPSEFLGYFLDASFVLTNSFHGTAFSINFNKPFFVITSRHKKNNSRQKSLLNLLDLEDRLLDEQNISFNLRNLFLDFSKANILLNREREKSCQYLATSIES